MKLYKAGDKSKAICHFCKDLVETTFGYHTVPFNDGCGSVPNIMAATCDQCGSVVSIPAQSTTAIKEARETFVPVAPPSCEENRMLVVGNGIGPIRRFISRFTLRRNI